MDTQETTQLATTLTEKSIEFLQHNIDTASKVFRDTAPEVWEATIKYVQIDAIGDVSIALFYTLISMLVSCVTYKVLKNKKENISHSEREFLSGLSVFTGIMAAVTSIITVVQLKLLAIALMAPEFLAVMHLLSFVK